MPHPLIAYPISRDTLIGVEGSDARDVQKFMTTTMPMLLYALHTRHNKFYIRMDWAAINSAMRGVYVLKEGTDKISLKQWAKEYMGKDAGSLLIELFMNYVSRDSTPVEIPKVALHYANQWIIIEDANWQSQTITMLYPDGEKAVVRLPKDMRGYVENTDIEWSYLMEAIATATLLSAEEGKEAIINIANEKTERMVFHAIGIEPYPSSNPFHFTRETEVWLYLCDENTFVPIHNVRYDLTHHLFFIVDSRVKHSRNAMYCHLGSQKGFAMLGYASSGEMMGVEVEARVEREGVWIRLDEQHACIVLKKLSEGLSGVQVWGVAFYDKNNIKKIKDITSSKVDRDLVLHLIEKVIR